MFGDEDKCIIEFEDVNKNKLSRLKCKYTF